MKLHKERGFKVSSLCGLFGISRQAYYQHKETDFSRLALRVFIIEYVREVCRDAPRMGCEKLYVMCRDYFLDLFCIGRDAFYRILRESGLMLKFKKRYKSVQRIQHILTAAIRA